MDFSCQDILFEGFPLDSFDIKERADINVDLNKGIFKLRNKDEDWNTYYTRERLAIKTLKNIIFSSFIDKEFKFVDSLNKNDEKMSEFIFTGGGAVLSLFASGGGSSSFYSKAKCVDERTIISLFNNFQFIIDKMRNTIDYVNVVSKENNGKIVVPFWLSRTGLSDRTKYLELISLGAKLEFKNKFGTGYELFDSSGRNIGDVTFGNDRTPKDISDDNEYFEIYKELEIKKAIVLKSVTLVELVKHGTEKGRYRKALGKVLLEYEVNYNELKLLEINRNVDLKNIIDNMVTLSMIDYNRKCDIIRGKIIPSYKYKNLFPLASVDNIDDYEILVDGELDFLSIEDLHLSLNELTNFWNVFCPLKYCEKNDEEDIENGFSSYREDDNLMYHLYTESRSNYSGFNYNIIRLGVYRKKKI